MKARMAWKPHKQQEKAMNDVIKKKSIEASRILGNNMDATALYTLHKTFGFGKSDFADFFLHFWKSEKNLLNITKWTEKPIICARFS